MEIMGDIESITKTHIFTGKSLGFKNNKEYHDMIKY